MLKSFNLMLENRVEAGNEYDSVLRTQTIIWGATEKYPVRLQN